MLKKFVVSFLICITTAASAQENSLTVNDLLGDWRMDKSNEHFPEIYLTKLESKENYSGYGVRFFIGKYTGKRRLEIFKPRPPRRKCGNDDSYYFYNDFGHQDIWNYNPNDQVLKVFDSKNNKEKQFEINIISSTELVLTQIK
ncbi:hypothetical protein [uncultured Aquimarina sp.]|uniref:hypothetical protein n=1 Tax=uncultured Aquimarina sp. TaxID=575652 RepID=UPI00262F7620|nr:hypothetical protein [uncultured Aquimarina sp.]